ncbi:MAG: nitroreductase [Flavobacteriales bacterium]|nr:nitroreductase [Flavobacteriales bacterium]|tara:strand:+ start:675 stop:1259 length:585 start_codon:yes stop_codon:yes gene_type:complete
MKHSLSDIKALIQDRRTIKPEDFKPRKVLDDQLREILNSARWAPTHGMTEPWHFVIFQENALIDLGKFMADTYNHATSSEEFNQKKFDKLLNRPQLSSVVIAICMKRQEIEKIPEIEEIEAVACAVQNMHLTATAYGLGGYWSSGAVCYSEEMKTFLNLQPKDKCLGLFYLGYPNIDWPKKHRKPLEYKTEWRK